MGLFDFLHASKAARDEKRAMREFAEEKRKAEQKRRAEEEAQRTEEARILREHEVPPAMACPEYDLGPFPFDNKPYLCHTVVKYERETGQVFADERSYYGDADAVAAVKANVAKLERMLTPAVTGVPSLPSLRTNFARVEAVDSVVKVPENRVMLSLHPLTKTGKTPSTRWRSSSTRTARTITARTAPCRTFATGRWGRPLSITGATMCTMARISRLSTAL